MTRDTQLAVAGGMIASICLAVTRPIYYAYLSAASAFIVTLIFICIASLDGHPLATGDVKLGRRDLKFGVFFVAFPFVFLALAILSTLEQRNRRKR